MQARQTAAADPPAGPIGAPAPRVVSERSFIARLAAGAVEWLERQALFVAALAVVAAVSLAEAPAHINQDAWLALVDGRYIAQHGIPQHDAFALLTHGARWIDQQWLAQLAIYGLQQLGGLSLYSIVYVLLSSGSFAVAIAAARRLGGSEAHVLLVLPAAAFLFFAGSGQIRTQGFAYPLFVATLWLLAAETRASSRRRVYFVFALLVPWANLHGSASVGAALVVLYGLSLLVQGARDRALRPVLGRGLALAAGAPLCLLLTPYGFSGIAYYRETLLNPAFKALLVEWQPVTSSAVLAIPFFATAFATIWVLGRSRGRAHLFETLALMMLIAGAISAVRNITWFGLAVIVLLPSLLLPVLGPRARAPRRGRLNLSLVAASLAFLLGSVITVATKPSSWFERDYDARALARVTALAERQPRLAVFAEEHFSDWLLWHDPSLAGRLAYDVRMELLSGAQLRELVQLTEVPPPGARPIFAGYGLLVLEPSARSSRLLDLPGIDPILHGNGVIVATQSPGA